MSLWEYKVITSGKGGFATPALLEKFLNDLGRDEWEIIHFQTPADNFLAFTGLVRRSTQRDWTLEDAAAAAAKAEAEKLRAEFEAKFKAAAGNAPAGGLEERAPSFLEEKVAPDDGFRKPVDTSRDDDPDAEEEEKADEWDKLTAAEEDELPTFFEAIKPHMRRNQRGPGMSVGVDYLAKKWDQSEDDLKGALAECGFVVPNDEDAKAEYVEYDGDLYWLNINRRGELWINTKEKPRPVFRPVKAARIEVEQPVQKDTRSKEEVRVAPASQSEMPERQTDAEDGSAAPVADPTANEEEKPGQAAGRSSKGETASAPLPEGPALLDKIRPHMRRNRRGPGGSGSASFLSRALRTNETELRAAFAGIGLTIPATPADKSVYSEFGNEVWWLNLDSRGGLWINGREKKQGETLTPSADGTGEAPTESAPAAPVPEGVSAPDGSASETTPAAAPQETVSPVVAMEADAPELAAPERGLVEPPAAGEPAPAAAAAQSDTSTTSGALALVRQLLKETKAGALSGKVEQLAGELGKPSDEFVASLVDAGLRVPEKPREKPVFVEHAGEMLWLNKTTKGELWLNAKASKPGVKEAGSDDAEEAEPSEGGEGEGEKKPGRRPVRAKTKKSEARESSEEKVES